MDVYRVVAWAGWVLNLAVAEWIIFSIKKEINKKNKILPGKF
jgi:hypothetical protein